MPEYFDAPTETRFSKGAYVKNKINFEQKVSSYGRLQAVATQNNICSPLNFLNIPYIIYTCMYMYTYRETATPERLNASAGNTIQLATLYAPFIGQQPFN